MGMIPHLDDQLYWTVEGTHSGVGQHEPHQVTSQSIKNIKSIDSRLLF